MNWVLAVPIAWRLGVLCAVGVCLGALANWATQRLAWTPSGANPWIPSPDRPRPNWIHRVPILGWLGLRGEEGLHGRWFWVPPMLVELASGAGVAGLYWWEIHQGGLLPQGLPAPWPPALVLLLHGQWACHVALAWLMLVASLVDANEKLIPDAITVPGTLAGLCVVGLCPWVLLPVVWRLPGYGAVLGFLTAASPRPWPAWLNGFPRLGSLSLAVACWWLWCVALMDRTWRGRRGWYRAAQLMLARLARNPSTWRLGLLGLLGTTCILAVWRWGSAERWAGLLTALIGMAAGGGLIWLVRIIGTATLQREAMGFGDVTLMAMLGAFLGWQSCLIIFFLAPLAALAVGLAQLVLRKEHEIPYGPFLCLAAGILIVQWRAIWAWLEPTLDVLGAMVLGLLLLCLVAMGIMLGGWRALRGLRR